MESLKFTTTLLSKIAFEMIFCLARGNNKLSPTHSDIDIVIEKKNYNKFLTLLTRLQTTLDFEISNVIKRHYVYTHILYLRKYKIFIQLDTEFDFDWWSLVIIDSISILNRSYQFEGLFYASKEDESFMKFYRSLLWGSRLTKYKNSHLLFDQKFVDESTYIQLPQNVGNDQLRNFYKKNTQQKIKTTLIKLFIKNIKVYGLFKIFCRFINFIYYELNLICSKNGSTVYFCPKTDSTLIKDKISHYIKYHNAPYKGIDVVNNISFFKKRKLLRDSHLLISKIKKNVDFEIYFENDSYILKNKDNILCNFNLKEINSLIYVMYTENLKCK